VYVSHRLSEVVRLADRCTVLRDGRMVDVSERGHIDETRLVRLMTGRDLEERHRPHKLAFDRPLLEASAAPVAAESARADRADRALVVRRGEVVGLGGLLGGGTTAILRRLYGARAPAGRFQLDGRAVTVRRPASAIGMGVGLVPGERRQGLVMAMSVRDNMALPLLRRAIWRAGSRNGSLEAMIARIIEALDIRPPDPAKPVRELSGGNQQKVLFARWLLSKVALLLLEEPTQGVDIGAKARIHRLMREFAEDGNGVLFASSELDEVVAISDTVFAVRKGRIVDRMARDANDYSEAALRRALAEGT
jgi:ABC-type sugar transport system ATPase subunit